MSTEYFYSLEITKLTSTQLEQTKHRKIAIGNPFKIDKF